MKLLVTKHLLFEILWKKIDFEILTEMTVFHKVVQNKKVIQLSDSRDFQGKFCSRTKKTTIFRFLRGNVRFSS